MIRIKDPHFLCKDGYFYRAHYRGYTDNPLLAGLYSKNEALTMVASYGDESPVSAHPVANIIKDINKVSEALKCLNILAKAPEKRGI